MTYLEVHYRCAAPLQRAQLERLAELPGHYGIQRVRLDEQNRIACIAFDASRLKESEVVHWIRGAGIPLTEKVDASQQVV